MEIKEVKIQVNLDTNKRTYRIYSRFEKLLVELRKRELPDMIVRFIDEEIDKLNLISQSEKELRKQLFKTQASILSLLKKELKIVPPNYYSNKHISKGMLDGMILGMPLGIPFGLLFFKNIALGTPLGMPIGMVLGTIFGRLKGRKLDAKAKEEGRQLDWS